MKVSQEPFSFQLESIFKLSFASNLAAPSKPLLFYLEKLLGDDSPGWGGDNRLCNGFSDVHLALNRAQGAPNHIP